MRSILQALALNGAQKQPAGQPGLLEWHALVTTVNPWAWLGMERYCVYLSCTMLLSCKTGSDTDASAEQTS